MTEELNKGRGPSYSAPKAEGGLSSNCTPPTWVTTSEAVTVCLYRPNRRRIIAIAIVVGTILVGINQGTILFSGHISWLVWIRILLDYITPACVSTMGVLAGTRKNKPSPPSLG